MQAFLQARQFHDPPVRLVQQGLHLDQGVLVGDQPLAQGLLAVLGRPGDRVGKPALQVQRVVGRYAVEGREDRPQAQAQPVDLALRQKEQSEGDDRQGGEGDTLP